MIAADDIRKKLEGGDEEARRLAVLELAGERSMEAVDLLVTALGDTSWRVRKTAAETLEGARDKSLYIPSLIDSLRNDDNAGLRNSAAEVLTRVGSVSVGPLIDAVSDADADVRKFAVDILGVVGDEGAVETLAGALRDDDENVKGAASEALGKIGGERAVKALLAILDDDDLWVRFATLEALARIKSDVPVEPVAKFLDDRILRKAAIEALSGSRDPEAIRHLAAATTDKGTANRASAVEALATVYKGLAAADVERAVDVIKSEVAPAAMTELLDSPFKDARRGAVVILAVLGRVDSPDRLLDMADDEAVAGDVKAVFMKMGKDGLEFLLDALGKGSDKRRAFILSILADVGGDGVLPALKGALGDSYGHARRAALDSLGRLGLVEVLDAVVPLLSDEYEDVADAAVSAIETIGRGAPGEVVYELSSALKSAEPRLKKNIVTILGGLGRVPGGEDALGAISATIKDESSDVRKAAASALGALGLSEGVESLAALLADEDKGVRLATVNALGNIRCDESFRLLALTAKDGDMWVRCAALRSTARQGTDEAFSAVAGAVLDAAGVVAITAIDVLSETFGKRAEDSLKLALEHDDQQVVKAAADKLKSL